MKTYSATQSSEGRIAQLRVRIVRAIEVGDYAHASRLRESLCRVQDKAEETARMERSMKGER